MDNAGSAETVIRAVAKQTIITMLRVIDVLAATGSIANVVGADIAIAGTYRPDRRLCIGGTICARTRTSLN
jgi:hypothetical protein